MKILEAESPRGNFVALVGPEEGNSTVLIPQGMDINKRIIEVTIDKTPIGVPISRFQLSLKDCLELIEQMYQGLIKAGWPENARQILPRGID